MARERQRRARQMKGRAAAMEKRAAAIEEGDIKAARAAAAEAAQYATRARGLADIMREASDRERGEETRYLGPSTEALRLEKTGVGTQTKWQDYNRELMAALGGNKEYYQQTWTPELQAYWAANQALPSGVVPKTGLGVDPRDLNLLSGLNITGYKGPGTTTSSAFQHPYAADPYTVPHMQTGAGWEGLGAEYQPGTVEGLGLIAGDAYAPYEPLARGLLDASPSFMGTGGAFGTQLFELGLDGATDSNTNTNTNTNTSNWFSPSNPTGVFSTYGPNYTWQSTGDPNVGFWAFKGD